MAENITLTVTERITTEVTMPIDVYNELIKEGEDSLDSYLADVTTGDTKDGAVSFCTTFCDRSWEVEDEDEDED